MRSWTKLLHQPAMLMTVPHSANIQCKIILPPNAWSHEKWSLFGCYTVLLGTLVLILEWSQCLKHLRDPEECENLTSHVWGWHTDYSSTTDVYFGGITLKLGSPHVDSLERAAWHVWHSSCYIYYLPACLTPWYTAFLEKVLVSVT
jgi:hypothetical protein